MAPATAARSRRRTDDRFGDAVLSLLGRTGWSQRDLARAVRVDPAHICRLLGPRPSPVSPHMLERVAAAFDVEPDYFREYREWCVVEAIRQDPGLREQLYRRVRRRATAPC